MTIKKKYIDMPVDWKNMCVEYKIGFEIEEGEGQFYFCEATYHDIYEAIVELHNLRYNNHSNAYKIFCRYVTPYKEYVMPK